MRPVSIIYTISFCASKFIPSGALVKTVKMH